MKVLLLCLSLSLSRSLTLSSAIDLLEKMLDLDPDTRISIDEAFKHPYIVSYHDPDDEPTSPPFDHSFEDKKLNAMGWRGEEFGQLLCMRLLKT